MLQRKEGQTAYFKKNSSLNPFLAKNVFYMHVYTYICVFALLCIFTHLKLKAFQIINLINLIISAEMTMPHENY